MTILTLPKNLINFAEVCIRLKLYHMYDLATEMNVRFEDLRDTMKVYMEEEYKYFTKGFTGAMARARKRESNREIDFDDEGLLQMLEKMIMRRYTVYDLSNLKEYDIEDLISRSKKVVDRINLEEIAIDFEMSIDSDMRYEDLLRYSSITEFQRDQLVRDWEIDLVLRKICQQDEFLVRKVLNNVWNNKNYSDKMLQSLAIRSLRNSQIDRSVSKIVSLNSNRSPADDVISLYNDLYSDTEIADMKSMKISKISQILKTRKDEIIKLSHADRRQIAHLHFEEVKKTHDMKNISELVLAGRLSLSEFCQMCRIPIALKKFVTEMNLLDGRIVRTGSSIFSARNGKSDVSNSAALQSIEESDALKVLFSEELSSEFYSERLYQIARIRDISNRKSILRTIFSRYRDVTGKVDKYPESEILSTLKIDMTLNDAIEFMNLGILNVTDHKMSSYEMKVKELLDDLNVEYIVNDRSVFDYSFEIDFLIKDKNLAIEVSPISSHHSNISTDRYFGAKPNSYHYQKYLNAKMRGYELITLYEYDLDDQIFKDFTAPLIRSKISKVRTVSARKTIFEEISTAEAREFLERCHRDGYRNSSRKFCLKLDDEIVAVATVSNLRKGVYRLERLAYRPNEKIVGGTSKLTKNLFKTIEDMQTLETFSDNDKGSGESYSRSGFTFISETGPRKIYVSNSDAKDRYSWQISGPFDHSTGQTVVGSSMINNNLDPSELNENQIEEYIETKLEHRLDKGHGYDRLFTAGSKKWKISRNEVIKCQ